MILIAVKPVVAHCYFFEGNFAAVKGMTGQIENLKANRSMGRGNQMEQNAHYYEEKAEEFKLSGDAEGVAAAR